MKFRCGEMKRLLRKHEVKRAPAPHVPSRHTSFLHSGGAAASCADRRASLKKAPKGAFFWCEYPQGAWDYPVFMGLI